MKNKTQPSNIKGEKMKKIHGYGCNFLDTNKLKDCDCYLSKNKKPEYIMSKEEAKAIVMRQYIENSITNK